MIKAVYLLAGTGSRLYPLTKETPKALLEINGRPILARSVDSVMANGVRDFVVVTGFQAPKVQEFFEERYPAAQVEYVHNSDFETTNNSFSLWLSLQAFTNETMLLLDGDIVFERAIIDEIAAADFTGNHLAVRGANDLGEEEMKVVLDANGIVQHIDKKLDVERCYGESLGIAKFSAPFVAKLQRVMQRRMLEMQRVNEYYEASFQELIDSGETITIVDTKRFRCMEIDTVEDFEAAKQSIIPFVDS